MLKKNLIAIIVGFILLAPQAVFALQMPTSANQLADMFGINAESYVVMDAATGQILMNKNSDEQRIPASLTKLVTALVVLDTKPNLYRSVTMTAADQVAGWCTSGGVCVKSRSGVKFTVDGLFNATIILSANNAANALARSTGLSPAQFAARMNKKAQQIGATHSHFNEPTGLDSGNVITAEDYAHIVTAAFSNPYLSKIAGKQSYFLKSTNYASYNQTIQNHDKLLGSDNLQLLGAKTGYLDQSKYNFAALVQNKSQQRLAIVVLGENHLYTAYDETETLAMLADQAQALAMFSSMPNVLGASKQVSLLQ